MPLSTYYITYFRDLIQAYPTWDALSAFLSTKEGGALLITQPGTNAIIRYDKSISTMDIPYVRWFRSVVWDTVMNRPLSIAPPKAMKDDISSWAVNDIRDKYVCQEYLEGVNLNVYTVYEEKDRPLHFATRNCFGATGTFYSKKTFMELLDDVMKKNGQTIDYLRCFLGPEVESAGATAPVSQFASFILQHPEHRVVQRIAEPNVYRIHYGYTAHDGTVAICEEAADIPQYSYGTEANVGEWFQALLSKQSVEWQGMVFKDGHGNRWRMKSMLYKVIRALRGATHRSDERFFSLRAQGLVQPYLAYYPEDTILYNQYESWAVSLVDILYGLYCKVHKEHSMKMGAVDRRYHVHLNAIQAAYMAQTGKRTPVKRSDVEQYIRIMPVPRLLFLMNYERRTPVGSE
jgi:hypothetical protein